MLTKGDHALGPGDGHVHLRTTREGVAAKVGHDLLIDLPRWSGRLTADSDDPAAVRLEITVELESFTVLEGTGGVAPLSSDDKVDITKTALKLFEVSANPTATFVADRVAPEGESFSVDGNLSLHGRTVPLRLAVHSTGERSWRATGSVNQSDFGIKPYRAFLGALRLADAVILEADLDLGRIWSS